MIGATRQPRERLCTACFTGQYPIELPGADKLGKNLLERPDSVGQPVGLPATVAPAASGSPAAGIPAADAAANAVSDAAIPADEDPAEKGGATGCDPGPDAEFEELLTDADRVPADKLDADKKEPV